MEIAQFITVNKDHPGKFYEGDSYSHTESGLKLFPVGSIVPVIRKGTDCIGLATIISASMSENSTKVTFSMKGPIGKESKKAFYNWYLICNGMRGDMYETDQMIPGAMGLGKKNSSRIPTDLRDVWDL